MILYIQLNTFCFQKMPTDSVQKMERGLTTVRQVSDGSITVRAF